MDWHFITTITPLYLNALKLTMLLGLLGVILSIIIGLFCLSVNYFKIPFLKYLVKLYVQLSRNTPLLILLFFVYYGLPKVGLSISARNCGIVGLAFLGGGYMAESFRSGVEAVGANQKESAISLGLSRFQTARFIILPQAIRISFPSVVSNVIFLIKETSVFSAISLMDLMFTTKDLIGLYYNTVECLVLLVVFYLLILLPISALGIYIKKRLEYA